MVLLVPELEIPVAPEFDTVMVAELVMVPPLARPVLPPEFDIVIVPELVMVPEFEIPVPDGFDTTNIMPAGIVSVSPTPIVNAVTVQVSGAVQVPTIASHEL